MLMRTARALVDWSGQARVIEVRLSSTRLGAGVAQLAERQPSKLHVAGSIPVSRSNPPPGRYFGFFGCFFLGGRLGVLSDIGSPPLSAECKGCRNPPDLP